MTDLRAVAGGPVRHITPGSTVWGDGRPYRRGDDSWAVVPLQMALNRFGNQLALDGIIGPATAGVVRAFQAHRGMTADAIAGPRTQERICLSLSTGPARDEGLPVGLLRGLVENESSFMLAAYTAHPSGDGFDLGVYQDAYEQTGTQDAYRHSLDVLGMAEQTARELCQRHDRYRSGGAGERLAWECAALGHNWPVAADRMARGRDPVPDADSPASWVEVASGGRLHTPREWADAYIARATQYVAW